MGVVRSRAGRTRVGMPEERVYFPAGIFPPHLGIDFPTVRDCVSFHCLSGLQILRRGRGLIMRGRTLCCADHSWSLLNWFQFLDSCFFPLNGPCRRRLYVASCVAHRAGCANKPDETFCLLICEAFTSTKHWSLCFAVLGKSCSCDLLVQRSDL